MLYQFEVNKEEMYHVRDEALMLLFSFQTHLRINPNHVECTPKNSKMFTWESNVFKPWSKG